MAGFQAFGRGRISAFANILEPNASIGRNARLFGATVRSEGRITGDLTIGAGRAEIGGNIGGAVRASADQVTVLPGAVVSGDLVVRSPDPPVVSPGAQVMGQVFHQRTDRGGAWPGWPLSWLGVFLALLLLGAAALAVSPDWSARVAETIRTRTLWSLVAGVIVLLAVPVVVALLLVTLIGIPLALVLAAAWVAALVLSAAFVSYRVGLWLLARAHRAGASRWGALALGALVVSLGMTLPAVGGIVALAVVLIGAGALVLERRVPVGA